jgi:hypothetical protein
MMDTSSPALFVWMMRTVVAASGMAIRRPRQIQRSLVEVVGIVKRKRS